MNLSFWQSYYQNTPDGLLLVDAAGAALDCNQSFLNLSGSDTGCIRGTPWEEFLKDTVNLESPALAIGGERCRGIARLMPADRHVTFSLTEILDRRHSRRGAVVAVQPLPPSAVVHEHLQRRLGELETTQVIMVNALARLAERREPDIGDHLERVRLYAYAAACRLVGRPGLASLEEVVQLSRVAVLHDLGKIGVPERILFKPGRLSQKEFSVVRRHPVYGAEFMEQTEEDLKRLLRVEQSFLSMAREICLYHHERYNGSGYPNGLSGEEIPLTARIVALADVYDALTSERVYKRSWSHTEAKDFICSENGSHFDPTVVQAFLDAEHEFEVICTSLVSPTATSA